MATTTLRETYKGRKLVVKKSREWGFVETFVNGVILGRIMGQMGTHGEREMSSLRGYVDMADDRPGAFAPNFYTGAAC